MNTQKREQLAAAIEQAFGDRVDVRIEPHGEVAIDVAAGDLVAVAEGLRDHADLRFEMLMDLAGVDYQGYGQDEWRGASSSGLGFGRAVNRSEMLSEAPEGRRFAVVCQLLSIQNNWRARLRCFCPDDDVPRVASLMGVWASADWFEREAFDLFGILFDGHPDLRRILTDYGFIGHPFRKDFPLSGHVEVAFDPDKGRVVYQPVSIAPRTLVPRVIREDNRYDDGLAGGATDA